MIKGQCLCGAIQYEYLGEIEQSILCYCQHCKLAQGSVAGWNSPLDQSKFRIVQGIKYLKEYFHTEHKARVFCMECASPIYSYRKDLAGVIRLRLGTVTEGSLPAPTEEFFTEQKPDFLDIKK
ncbi:GFA family protein [Acinetobacter gerneri]|uniref:GFA family protein n=1 Tax=Acinetobacter gerneri TaxID=202952 RepID=UPI002935A896|nr:GFA family protein [Acinetobacter gerneri]MDV2439113.1 GFA family protein [Acinetobacter gerneri]